MTQGAKAGPGAPRNTDMLGGRTMEKLLGADKGTGYIGGGQGSLSLGPPTNLKWRDAGTPVDRSQPPMPGAEEKTAEQGSEEGVPPEEPAKEKAPGDPVLLREGSENQGKEAQAADLVQKAMLKLDRGDWEGAIADLTEAIGLDPENHAAWLGRAMAHNMAGKYAEAEADAKKAIELDSQDARAWTTLAWAQFKQGKFAEALASAQKAIALDPKSALAHAVAAYAREALGDKAGALLSIQSAARLDGRFFDQYRRGKSGHPILDGSVDIDRLLLERRFRSNYERGRNSSLHLWLIASAAVLASIACFLLFRKGRGIGGRDLLAKSLDYLKKDFGKR